MEENKNLSPFQTIIKDIVNAGNRLENIGNQCVFLPLGITSSSFQILVFLNLHKSLTPSEIKKYTGGKLSNISQRISVLEKKELVKRRYPSRQSDKRQVFIEMTPKGKELYKKASAQIRKAHTKVEEFFTVQDLDKFVDYFTKFHEVIDYYEAQTEELMMED
ncbi:MAG: MarR family transcriptional regulator [Candidatus Gracilibacteria bacterium]|jgi:DNA-binding MarR family transcriptional regulator|nr:MarR family transcriptional regulator [Candidatus Gracilibacteria bacterium]